MVHISSLADDFYRFDRAGHVIAGHRSGNAFRLGDTVRVAVAPVDVDAANSISASSIARRCVPKGRIKPPAKSRGRRDEKPEKSSSVRKKKGRPVKSESREPRDRKSPKNVKGKKRG